MTTSRTTTTFSQTPSWVVALMLVWNVVLLKSGGGVVGAGTFVDDIGKTFEIAANAKIAVRANYALSLSHLGLTSENIVAVYGNWAIRGGNHDLTAGNGIDLATTRFASLEPNADDLAFLEETVNLSPTCYASSTSCNDIEYSFLDDEDLQVDYWVVIANGFIPNGMVGNLTERGIPMIFIDTVTQGVGCRTGEISGDGAFVEYKTNPDQCLGRSSIDVINKKIELVEALDGGISSEARKEHEDLCTAATKFSASAKAAHERGVRAMAITYAGVISGQAFLIIRPILEIQILRTLEELGMPFLHKGLCNHPFCEQIGPQYETYPAGYWFTECDPTQPIQNCSTTASTAYPVDFWLFDTPTFPATEDANTLELFPDPAFRAAQWAYYPLNFGALSPESVARYLDYLGDELDKAQPVHPTDKPTCVNVDTTSDAHVNWKTGGLNGTLACYNEDYIQSLYCEVSAKSSAESWWIAKTTTWLMVLAVAPLCVSLF